MTVREKTRRRVLILMAVLILAGCGLGGLYVRRQAQRSQRAQEHRAEGIAAFEEGRYRDALDGLGHYLKRNEQDVEVMYRYAQARLRVPASGNAHIPRAIGVLQRVLQLEPDYPRARHDLLDLYVQVRYSSEALDLAEAILARDPVDHEALRAKAICLARLRRFDQALPFARQSLEADGSDLAMQLLFLDILKQLDRPVPELVAWAQNLRDAHPDDPLFELVLGHAYRLAYDRKNAIKWLRSAAAHAPPDDAFIVTLVRAFDEMQLFTDSIALLEKVAQDDDRPSIHREIIRRLWESGRGEDVAGRLESLDPAADQVDVQLVAYRALALYELGRPDQANALVSALGDRHDDTAAAGWASVLHALYGVEHPDAQRVIEACKEALSQSPHHAFFAFALGNAYASVGENELALASWKNAAMQRPIWAAPRIRQATMLLSLGRLDDALSEALAASRVAPHSIDAAIIWALVRGAGLAAGHSDSSEELLKLVRAIQTAVPREPRTLPLFVSLLVQNQQNGEATRAIAEALDAAEPLGEQVLLRLAQISQTRGLGLQDECFKRIEKSYGFTPRLALARALNLAEQGRAEEGIRLLESTPSAQRVGDELDWQLARARYLDEIRVPEAKAHWEQLARQYPRNVRVQELLLKAHAVQDDADLIDKTIERLRALTGERNAAWQIQRARWLIQNAQSERDVSRATAMLGQIVAQTPTHIEARLLLARGLEQLHYTDRAIQELVAVAHVRPDSIAVALDLARLYQLQRDFDRALRQAQRVVQNPKASPESQRRAAVLMARQGADEDAIEVLEQLGRGALQPNDALVLATLYSRRNEPEKTRVLCERLLETPTAESIRFAAAFYASQGENDRARAALELLDTVSLAPGVSESILAMHAWHTGAWDQGLEHARAAVRQAPGDPRMHHRVVEFLLLRGQGAAAVAEARRGLKALPADQGLALLQEHGGLVEMFADHPRLRPLVVAMISDEAHRAAAVQALQIVAEARQENEQVGQVAYRLRQVAQTNPHFLALQNLLAQVYIAAGQPDDAAAIATRTMKSFPRAVEPAWLASEALAAADRWDEAIVVARQWRQRAANEPIAADMMIAEANMRLGDVRLAHDQIEPYLERALASPDVYTQVIARYARTLIAGGKTDAAADLLLPLLPKSRRCREAWMGLAVLAVQDAEVGASWLQQVQPHVAPGDLEERAVLAQRWATLAVRHDRPEFRSAAVRMLDAVLEDPDATAKAWFMRGVMADQDRDLPVAEACYRSALKLEPLMHVAKNNLAMILVREPRTVSEALRLAQEAVSAMPTSSNYLDTLATAQALGKDYEKAIASLRAAVSLEPENPKWKLNLAELLEDAGRGDEANRIRRNLRVGRAEDG